MEEYDQNVVPYGGMLLPEIIEAFHESLKKRLRGKFDVDAPLKNPLPPGMDSTLGALGKIDTPGQYTIAETCDISYHQPSQMFNMTQMHRFASLGRLTAGLNNDFIRCNNFVEVRGQPTLEGNYVPLQMLHMFAGAFDLTITHEPACRYGSVIHDPSDFSRMSSRIVLAHEGLVGYASMTRTQDQVLHCPKEENDFAKYPRSETFMSTYFGDWKVLPSTTDGIPEYTRPTHWAKYKTAEESEEAANMAKHKILTPMSVFSKSSGRSKSRPVLGDRDPGAHCHLAQATRDRTKAIADVNSPYKRPVEDTDPESTAAQLRRRANNTRLPKVATLSAVYDEPNLERKPPGHLDDPNQPFPQVQEDIGVVWSVKRMLDVNKQPDDEGVVSVGSSVRRELAIANARNRAEPTERDETSLEQKRAQLKIRGMQEFVDTGSLERGLTIGSGLSLLSPAVRAMDNRSFNNFGIPVPAAPYPQSRVAHTSDTQSFYSGQSRQRPRGVTHRQHQRSILTPTELANYREPGEQPVPGRDGDEDIPNTDVPLSYDSDGPDGSDDSLMTDAEQ